MVLKRGSYGLLDRAKVVLWHILDNRRPTVALIAEELAFAFDQEIPDTLDA